MTLGDLIVKIGGDTKDFDNSIKEVKKSVGGIGESLKSGLAIGAGLKIFDAISEGFTSAVSAGWNFNSTMEQTLASFQTMLGGSKDKADAMVTTLQKMASTTPFETTDLAKGATTLMGFGIEASKVENILRMLGDASQGNRERFNSLTLAFAQVSSAGKLTGGDLLQMINAGFNPLQTISQQTGKSMAVLKDEMSKGAISADMVTKAFESATSKGGLFYQSMEKQSKTFEGQMSTLRDAISMTFGTIMKPLFDWVSNVGLPKIIELTTKVQTLFTNTKESTFFKSAKQSIEFLYPVIEGIKKIMQDVIAFITPWVNTFKNSFQKLASDLTPTWEYIKKTFDSLRPAFKVIWGFIKPILDDFIILLKFVYNVAYGVVNGIILAFNPFIKTITSVFATATNIFSAFVSLLKGDFSNAFQFWKEAVNSQIETVKNIFLTLYNFFDGLTVGMVSKLVNMGKEIVKGLWKGIENNITWLKNKISEWVGSVSKQIKQFFGIASPSKLTTGYGENISEGLANGIKNKSKEAVQKTKEMAEEVKRQFEELKTATLDKTNKMGDAIMTALKNQYSKQEKARVDSINKDFTKIKIHTNRVIKEYERELQAKLGVLDADTRQKMNAVQKEIDALNEVTEAEEKALKEQEYNNRVATLQKELTAVKSAYEQENLQNELNGALELKEAKSADEKEKIQLALNKSRIDLQDKYKKEQLQIQNELNTMFKEKERENLLALREMKIKSLNDELQKIQEQADEKRNELQKEFDRKKLHEENMLKVKTANLNEELQAVKDYYADLQSEEKIQAEARFVYINKSNAEIIELLNNYNSQWKNAGKSWGEQLLQGIESKKKSIQQAVNEMMALVNTRASLYTSQTITSPVLPNTTNTALNMSPATASAMSGTMNVQVNLDGRTIAKATAPNMVKELKLQGVYS